LKKKILWQKISFKLEQKKQLMLTEAEKSSLAGWSQQRETQFSGQRWGVSLFHNHVSDYNNFF
jgi:hypothetical protein